MSEIRGIKRLPNNKIELVILCRFRVAVNIYQIYQFRQFWGSLLTHNLLNLLRECASVIKPIFTPSQLKTRFALLKLYCRRLFRNCHPLRGSEQTPCSEPTWSLGRGQRCRTLASPPKKNKF